MTVLPSGKSTTRWKGRKLAKRYFIFYSRDGKKYCTSIKSDDKVEALKRALTYAPFEKVVPEWVVDQDAVNTVKGLLKIRWPVRVQRIFGLNSAGVHTLRKKPSASTPHHSISVERATDTKQADRLLWHEFCHAMQSEEAGSIQAWKAACDSWAKLPYDDRPHEIEATAYEQCAEFMPLTKEV